MLNANSVHAGVSVLQPACRPAGVRYPEGPSSFYKIHPFVVCPFCRLRFGFMQTHLALAAFLFSRATLFLQHITTRERSLSLTRSVIKSATQQLPAKS